MSDPDRREELDHKLAKVRRWLEAASTRAILVAGPGAFAWITCGGEAHVSLDQEVGTAAVLVTREHAFVLAANNEMRRIVDEELDQLPFEPVTWPWYQSPRALVERLGGTTVLSDAGQLGLPRAGASFAALRYTLVPAEIARYRSLGHDAAAAVEAACREAVPGDRERDLAARVARDCVARGIQPLVLLVAGDERVARYRHPLPTDHRWQHALMVALTGRRKGLHASLTRMVCVGAPDATLATRFKAVQRVDAAMLIASRPGASLDDVLARARMQYAAEGFASEWELHHQGGLTGYAGRERFATPGDTYALGASQAVAWNPSITSVKSEDTALVTERGIEILTATERWPRELVAVEDGALTRPALVWQHGSR